MQNEHEYQIILDILNNRLIKNKVEDEETALN